MIGKHDAKYGKILHLQKREERRVIYNTCHSPPFTV